MGAKEILMKAVLQAILVFVMAIFKIPKKLIKELTDAIAGFWWGDTEIQKKMHWCAWWRMCIPKKEGGMGFRDLYSFNRAMLAKQTWRLLSSPESLCVRVLRAKYYPTGDLESGTKKGLFIHVAKHLGGAQNFQTRTYLEGWRYGSQINIWNDPWIPTSPTRKVYT
jgi:hypothetical protein